MGELFIVLAINLLGVAKVQGDRKALPLKDGSWLSTLSVRGQKPACQMKKRENFLSAYAINLLGVAKVQGDRKALPLKDGSRSSTLPGARAAAHHKNSKSVSLSRYRKTDTLFAKKAVKGAKPLFLLDAFVGMDGQRGADRLEQLHKQNEKHDREDHDKIFVAVITVVDGDLAQSSAADNAAHRGIA